MRKLSPAFLATAVAVALASTTAVGQLRTQTGTAVGTNGSTATTSSTGRTASGATTFSRNAPTETVARENVRAPDAGQSTSTSSGTGSSSTSGSDTAGSAFNTSGNNNVVGTTGNFAQPGALLGVSPGQTSAGTAGAASAGLGVTGDATSIDGTGALAADGTTTGLAGTTGTTGNTGLNTNLSSALPGAVVVPGATFGATTGFTGGMGDASGINANGERVGSGGADFRAGAAVTAPTPTPLFNQAAARGAARDAARRARGDEPRIIGLAPRTERDLTHQMPDDPIIRY